MKARWAKEGLETKRNGCAMTNVKFLSSFRNDAKSFVRLLLHLLTYAICCFLLKTFSQFSEYINVMISTLVPITFTTVFVRTTSALLVFSNMYFHFAVSIILCFVLCCSHHSQAVVSVQQQQFR